MHFCCVMAHDCRPALLASPCPPARVARFYMQPRAERKATYARWWGIVKKEAKHYWVSWTGAG